MRDEEEAGIMSNEYLQKEKLATEPQGSAFIDMYVNFFRRTNIMICNS
jgi:hypothetical protein